MTKRRRDDEMKFREYPEAEGDSCSFIAEIEPAGYFVVSTTYDDKLGVALGPFATMKEAQSHLAVVERGLMKAGATEQLLN
jgi:hypothetical protein